MADTCTNLTDRGELIVAYLYDDVDAASRAAFEAHLTSCAVCRDELESLRGVRRSLVQWAPPEPNFVVGSRQPPVVSQQSPVASLSRRSWREIPAWAQVAAALLFLGVAAGLANLNVRYDSTGLTVRTGWMRSESAAVPAPASADAKADAVSRAELVALEQRLRGELRTLQTSAHASGANNGANNAADNTQPPRAGVADADLMRRVRTLVEDSEKRQQRELALRVGEALMDVNARRQADLVKIDRSLDQVQNSLGVEVLKQRERVNYLMRANQSIPVR